MKSLAYALTVPTAVFTVALIAIVPMASAQSLAPRTWVSGTGSDTNPCTRALPCAKFAVALGKTAANGVINCLDAGDFGGVSISKSVTIDCHGTSGNVPAVQGNVSISIEGPNVVVTLRNLNLDGAATGVGGIAILAARTVFIENCTIQGFTSYGIADARDTAGALFITDTTVRNSNSGIMIYELHGNELRANSTRVVSAWNSVGLLASRGARVMVKDSEFSSNTTGVAGVA